MQQLIGYYYSDFPRHFVGDDGIRLGKDYHTVASFLEPYMVQLETPRPVVAKDGFTSIPTNDERMFHQMPINANWEYVPRDGMISYRHRAIAVVDFETYDEPRLIEVRLLANA